jgi:hypothetical protein
MGNILPASANLGKIVSAFPRSRFNHWKKVVDPTAANPIMRGVDQVMRALILRSDALW